MGMIDPTATRTTSVKPLSGLARNGGDTSIERGSGSNTNQGSVARGGRQNLHGSGGGTGVKRLRGIRS